MGEAGDLQLREAEQWLTRITDKNEQLNPSSAEMVVVNKEQFLSLPAMIATVRAFHAQALGDVPSTVKYAQQALDLLPKNANRKK